MKSNTKLLTIFLLTIIAGECYAQEKFTTYDNDYSGKTYEIEIYSKDKDKFTLYIEAMSVDRLHNEGGIRVNEKQHQDFIKALTEAKLKYEEWVKTAIANNVKELDKTMIIKSKVGGYFKYGDWNFQDLVYLTFDFKILENKGELKYLLITRTGELQSSSNQFMKVDGFVLVFSSTKEIDEFTTSISTEKIKDFLNKPKSKDLFKD